MNTTTSLRTGPISCQFRIRLNQLSKNKAPNSSCTKTKNGGSRCLAYAPGGPEAFIARKSTTAKVRAIKRRSQVGSGRSVATSASASAAAPLEDDSNSKDRLTSFLKIVGAAVLILAILHFEDVVAGIQWSIYQLKLIGSADSMEALQSAIGSFIVGAWTGAIKTASNWVLIEGGRVAGLIESVASAISSVLLSFWLQFTNQISGFFMGVEKAVLYVTGMISFIPVIPALIAKVVSTVTGILTWKPLALPAALAFTLTKVFTTWILSTAETICELFYITPFSILAPAVALIVYFRKEWVVSVADVEKLIAEKMAKASQARGVTAVVEKPPTVVERPPAVEPTPAVKTPSVVKPPTVVEPAAPLPPSEADRVMSLWETKVSPNADISAFLSSMSPETLAKAEDNLKKDIAGVWSFDTTVESDEEAVMSEEMKQLKKDMSVLWDFTEVTDDKPETNAETSTVGGLQAGWLVDLIRKRKADGADDDLQESVKEKVDMKPVVISVEMKEKFADKFEQAAELKAKSTTSAWLVDIVNRKVPQQTSQSLNQDQRLELQREVSALWNFQKVADNGEVELKNLDVSAFLSAMSDSELAQAQEKLAGEVKGMWNFNISVKTDYEEDLEKMKKMIEEEVGIKWDFKVLDASVTASESVWDSTMADTDKFKTLADRAVGPVSPQFAEKSITEKTFELDTESIIEEQVEETKILWDFKQVTDEPTTTTPPTRTTKITGQMTKEQTKELRADVFELWNFETVSSDQDASEIMKLARAKADKSKTLPIETVNKMKSEIVEKQKAEYCDIYNMEGRSTTDEFFRGKVSSFTTSKPKDSTTPQEVKKMEEDVFELWNFKRVETDTTAKSSADIMN